MQVLLILGGVAVGLAIGFASSPLGNLFDAKPTPAGPTTAQLQSQWQQLRSAPEASPNLGLPFLRPQYRQTDEAFAPGISASRTSRWSNDSARPAMPTGFRGGCNPCRGCR